MKKKYPLFSLQNQYTFLHRQQNRVDPLIGLLTQLRPKSKILPNIDKKYLQSARRVQKKLQQVQNIVELKKLRYNLLSQQRFNKPIVMPMYIPMPITIPTMNFSALLPQVQLSFQPLQNNVSQIVQPQPIQEQNTSKPQNIMKPEEQKKQQVSKKPKQINKFAQKSKLNRFRIAAYAVYFSIYVKYFSRKFTQLRQNWFNDRYAINDGKIIFDGSAKILKHLYQIDIYKMVQSAKQRVKQIQQEEQQSKNSKSSNQILTLINFITLLIQYAKQYMSDPKFIKQNHQVFTVGVLTQNFMLSNLYTPQQAAILHIHPRGYILVQQEIQVILLMFKIIIKIMVYNFLLGLKFSRQWNNKQQKSHGLDDSDMEQLWRITRNAGLFLQIVCQQIYDKTYEEMVGKTFPFNFKQMSIKFNISAAKSLQQIKKSREAQNPNDANSKLIINLDGYSDMQALIASSQALKKYKQKIKMNIIDMLTNIYSFLKQQEGQVYNFMRNMTLDQQYVIFKGMKQDMSKKKKKKKGKKGSENQQDEYGYGNNTDSKGNSNKNSKGKKNNVLKDKDKNSMHINKQKQSSNQDESTNDRKNKNKNRWQQLDEENNNNDQNDDDSDDSNDEDQHKRKNKKLRFKHQQAFYDHKFDGHQKLMKLKKKMAKK